MRANPGNITGSGGTVATYSTLMYKKEVSTYKALVTQIGRLIPPDMTNFGDNASYNEVYPRNVGFQLGIRY